MFLGDETNIDTIQEKVKAISEVANFRDALYMDSEDKMMKVIIGGVIGAWAIYHFLIKR